MSASTFNRRSYSSFFTPAKFKAVVDKSNAAAQYSTPLGMCQSFAVMCYEFVIAFVSGLLISSSPSAVFRCVVTVIVSTIKCHSIRAVTHIRKKVRERVFPLITYLYASAAIEMKLCGTFIITTLFHLTPSIIDRLVKHSMDKARNAYTFFLQTATRLCMSFCQVTCCGSTFATAVTNAEPLNLSGRCANNWRNGSEATKNVAGNVFGLAGKLYNFVSHFDSPVIKWLGERPVNADRSPIIARGMS